MKKRSLVIHQPKVNLPAGNTAVVAPIYQSVKFVFNSWESLEDARSTGEGFYYSRSSNPTVRQLELTIAELQDRDDAIAMSSGMAAISTCLLGILKAGDHLLFCMQSYRPGRILIRETLGPLGINHTIVSIHDFQMIERVMAEKKPRAILFESPSNPLNHVADLERIISLARKYETLTVLDNTMAGLHNHGQYDVDYFVHSLTKFAGGHSDVLGGAVIANKSLLQPIRKKRGVLGCTLDPHAAFLILRGLKTYFVRFDKQCNTAMQIANYLSEHPKIRKVHYPGCVNDPGHALAAKQMHEFGAIVSFELNGNLSDAISFINTLKLFLISGSLGSAHSLAIPIRNVFGDDLNQAELKEAGIEDGSVRLCIGLEDVDDLQEDLEQALSATD